MPPKKKEAALYEEVNSQEEWESLMGKEGLWVIDIYQDWCGPCNAMHGNFRRIRNDTSDDLLQFAIAKIDNIESLQDYRGRCEPCFLFYAGGTLVSFVHGANAPLVTKTILEQLDREHKVVKGLAKRKQVQDSFILAKRLAEKKAKQAAERERRLENEQMANEGFTVAFIKPNVLKAGKVNELLSELKKYNIEILAQEERNLTEEEVLNVYGHLSNESFFEDFVRFMTSGSSRLLVLTKKQTNNEIIHEWRNLLGPPIVEEAKSNAPDSLRAKYGMQGFMNGLHGSDSKMTAERELAVFFPAYHVPIIRRTPIQFTLAIIRPEAFKDKKDEILGKIKGAGFKIAMQKVIQLTKQQVEHLYSEQVSQSQLDQLVAHMMSGPSLALGLGRSDAVDKWLSLLGPTSVDEAKAQAKDSLRAQFAVDNVPINQLHGSDSAQSAKKELEFLFPMEETVAIIKPDAYGKKDVIIGKILDAGFLISARKETTINKKIAQALYEDMKGAKFYEDLINFMTSGTAMFMILSRLGAVDGWRQEIGPTDPAVAKVEAPDSIRAELGKDILHNAVYGAKTIKEAQRKRLFVFSKLDEFPDEDLQDLFSSTDLTTIGSDHKVTPKQAPGKGDTTSAAKKATSAQEKPVVVVDEGSPEAKDAPPASEDTQPAPEDTQPAPEDTQPAPEDTQPASEDTRPAPEDTRPAPEDTRPAPEDTQPAPEDTQPAPEDTQPAPEDTQPVPEDTQPAPEDTQPVPEDTQSAPEDTQPPSEEPP